MQGQYGLCTRDRLSLTVMEPLASPTGKWVVVSMLRSYLVRYIHPMQPSLGNARVLILLVICE